METLTDRKTLIAESAADFAKWLNASKPSTEAVAGRTALAKFSVTYPRAQQFARERIRPLVELALDFIRHRSKQRSKRAQFEIFEEYVGKIDPLLTRIAKLHPIQPTFSDLSNETGIPTFEYAPIPKNGRRDRLDPMFTQAFQNSEELTIRLNQFFTIAREGVLSAFHRCALPSCEKYFHALRPERRYCSKGCQRNQYLEDPHRARKNAADQKVYYYTRKVLDLAKNKDLSAANRKEYDRAERSLKSAKRGQAALRSAVAAKRR
jgi:hypothetical protein